MKPYYSNRQQKIYTDYQGYSSLELKSMMTSGKYIAEVIEVCEDLLIERNELPVEFRKEKAIQQKKSSEKFLEEERKAAREECFKKAAGFIEKYQRLTDEELSAIVAKCTKYELAAVVAALEVISQRGTISEVEKNQMLMEIEDRFSAYNELKKNEARQFKFDGKAQLIAGLLMLAGGGASAYFQSDYGFWSAMAVGGFFTIKGFLKMI
jgi:hypothetical protein